MSQTCVKKKKIYLLNREHLSFPFQPHHNRIPIYMYPSPLDLARNITKFVSKLTKIGRTTSLDIKLLDIVQVCESDSNANKSFLDDVLPANNNFFHSGNTPITPVRASSQIADDEFHNSPPTPTPTVHTSAAHQSPENSKDSNGNITMSA